ncbi:response regulator [Halocalculus aciditolerans]|uniref:DNA-binding protein n=1 Tax=Halocalculus aciditolerans TaxID=1383812 RepID=A0A830F648_9EURY|nr:response regulator [Halocalculus aciditolerans]GGL66805.1 DNA-binding protein [Halocalculus aciditolerans]
MGECTVLVVDDEPAFLDLARRWLGDSYDLVTAENGDEALDSLSERVDVVLLDRRLPGRSGSEVLAEIRSRGVDCRVVMVTAVQPELDVVDWEFDDYVVKPVTEGDLRDAVEQMCRRADYDAVVQRYFAVASKVAALKENRSADGRAPSGDLQRLEARLQAVTERADDALDDAFDDDRTRQFYGNQPDGESGEE